MLEKGKEGDGIGRRLKRDHQNQLTLRHFMDSLRSYFCERDEEVFGPARFPRGKKEEEKRGRNGKNEARQFFFFFGLQ